jgi:hypothetical protein
MTSSQDPLRTPVYLLIAGWCVGALGTLVSSVASQLVFRDGISLSMYRATHFPTTLVYLGASVMLCAGAGLLASKQRPGAQFARVACVAFGMGAASSLLYPVLAALGVSLTGFQALGFLSTIGSTIAMVTLALSLRALARSRAREIDLLVTIALCSLSLPVLVSLLNLLGLRPPQVLASLVVVPVLLARGALAVGSHRLLLADGIADPQFLPGSAYRGPAGAIDGVATDTDQGSLPLGFLAGFLGGLIGFIIVRFASKKPLTQRGALIGFVVQSVLGLVIRIALH